MLGAKLEKDEKCSACVSHVRKMPKQSRVDPCKKKVGKGVPS